MAITDDAKIFASGLNANLSIVNGTNQIEDQLENNPKSLYIYIICMGIIRKLIPFQHQSKGKHEGPGYVSKLPFPGNRFFSNINLMVSSNGSPEVQ
jgi:hypothetical protein